MHALKLLSQSLGAKVCAEVARALEGIDAKEEPWAETLAHDQDFEQKYTNLREKVTALVHFQDRRNLSKKIAERANANTANRRKVMVDFATRAYELDKGRRPASLAELVPTYLKAVPVDPVTGKSVGWQP